MRLCCEVYMFVLFWYNVTSYLELALPPGVGYNYTFTFYSTRRVFRPNLPFTLFLPVPTTTIVLVRHPRANQYHLMYFCKYFITDGDFVLPTLHIYIYIELSARQALRGLYIRTSPF